MEYILNETPVKTTNGFRINNIKVDLDIKDTYEFHDYKINNRNIDVKETIEKDFISNIGLKHNVYKNLIININENINELLEIEYEFKNEDSLIDNIVINMEENSSLNLVIKYVSSDETYNFHNGKLEVISKANSKLNVTIINKLNDNSSNLYSIDIKALDDSLVTTNLLDLNGNKRIYNVNSITDKKATSNLNNIYIGKDNDLIDMNYRYVNNKEESNNNIEVQGLLKDNSIKHFKGTIDFIEGSKNSIGKENENCVLLSKTCRSKSLPMLLCHEENVEGAHSVSTGTLDKNKLFYLMSHGIDESEATKLIIKSNFNSVINNIPETIKEEISDYIDSYI